MMNTQMTDKFYMGIALSLAREAFDDDEVPVGAVAVHEGRIVGKGRNRMNSLNDPTAHAEMEAISAAAGTLGQTRLDGVTLYVTLEPCTMCTGALVLARVKQVIYAVDDPKTGACGSLFRLHDEPLLNHQFLARHGPFAEESAKLLQSCFQRKRNSREHDLP